MQYVHRQKVDSQPVIVCYMLIFIIIVVMQGILLQMEELL